MLPENSENAFKTAYVNVGLYSDSVWILGEPDDFQKANQELWVHYNRINNFYSKETKDEVQVFPDSTNKRVRTVKDTIPFSRLAQYGTYVYNEDRERLYVPDYTSAQSTNLLHKDFESPDSCEEIWMSPEVDEVFIKLTCVDDEKDQKLWTQQITPFMHEVQEEDEKQKQLLVFESWASILPVKYPKLTESFCNSQQESIFCNNVAGFSVPHWIEPLDLSEYPTPRYSICSSQELTLELQINSPEIKELWNKAMPPNQSEEQFQSYRVPTYHHNICSIESAFDLSQSLAHRLPPPTLNADVPEFFPKANMIYNTFCNEDESGQRYFPSAHDINDQNELFPYINITDKRMIAECTNDFDRMPHTTGLLGLTTYTMTESTNLQQSSSTKCQCPITSITCRAPQQRFQQHVSTLIYTHSHASNDTLCHETPIFLNKYHVSAPRNIPVYQRPPEFYVQQQDVISNGSSTCYRRRQGGGVDFSNLILLTRGSKGHHQIQNTLRQQVNINQMQSETTMTCSQHQQQPTGSILLGRDFLSGLSLQSSTCEGLHKCTQQDTSNLLVDNVSLTEEHFVRSNLKKDETQTYTTSVHQWLDFNYTDREDEFQDVDTALEEFFTTETEFKQDEENVTENSRHVTKSDSNSNGFLLMEVDNFPPIVPNITTGVSTSTMTDDSFTVQKAIPNQESNSFSSLLGKMSNASCVNAKKRLYRDVLANMAIGTVASSVTSVADNCLDPRFEELERQALEQYHLSEENLGQRFQQQRSSEESISQRFQELERQALEQYHCSNSSITEGCVAEARENDRTGISGTNIKNDGGTISSQQSVCSDMEHCESTKNALLGGDQTKSPPSKGTISISHLVTQSSGTPKPAWNLECCSGTIHTITRSNVNDKHGPTSSNSTQSHHELPGYSGAEVSTAGDVMNITFISNNLNNWKRPAAASKSLSAIGSTSPITVPTKYVKVPLGADGDKAGDGRQPDSSINMRHLALITPVKKQNYVPTDINGADVGPQLLVVAQGIRGGGQTMGSIQGPRRLVTTTFKTSSQVSKAVNHCTKVEEARKNKSYKLEQQQNTEQNLGGGGDDNPCSHQQNQENNNQNLLWAQVPEKSHPVLKHNNGGESQYTITDREAVIDFNTSETWVHPHNHHSHQSSEMSSNYDKLQSSSTVDLEQLSCTKLPPWMNKQRKKRPTPRNKKKKYRSSGKRGSSFHKRIRGVSSECDLIINDDDTPCNTILNNEKNELQKYNYNKILEKELSNEENILYNEKYNKQLYFNSSYLISIIPQDFQIETCPQKYIIDHISNSKLATTAFVLNNTIHSQIYKLLNKNIFVQDECITKFENNKMTSNIYMLNPELMLKESNIKLQEIIQNFGTSVHLTNLTQDVDFTWFLNFLHCNRLILTTNVDKTECKTFISAKSIESSIYENLILVKNMHILKLNNDIVLLNDEMKNTIDCIRKGCNLQSQKVLKEICDIKITISQVKANLQLNFNEYNTSMNRILQEARNIIFSSNDRPTASSNIQRNSPNVQKETNLQTQMYEIFLKNVSTQSAIKSNVCPTLLKWDSKSETHSCNIPENSDCSESEPKKCLSRNTLLGLLDTIPDDTPKIPSSKKKNSDTLSKENKDTEVHLMKELPKLIDDRENFYSDGIYFRDCAILSNETIKNSTNIYNLRQDIFKTICSVCGKWKKIKQSEESGTEYQEKKKQDSKCTVQ